MTRIGYYRCMLVVIVVVWAAESHGEGNDRRPLTDRILHYEPVSYDPTPVKAEHERVRRSHDGGIIRDFLQLSLEAFGRDFTLKLRPSRQVFASGVRFEVGGAESAEYDPMTFYQGKVVGDSQSKVSGHVIDGVFDGVIATSEGEYHVENSGKFFRERRDFHSVIYRTEDVVFPESNCAKTELMNELQKIQATAKPVKSQQKRATPLADRSSEKPTLSGLFKREQRQRRAITVNGNRFCLVLVAADHLFNNAIGRNIPADTMAEIVTVFSQVQDIFAEGDFDEDGNPDGIIPLIATIQVLDENMPGYRFGAPTIRVQDFLDLWSEQDHSEFCLALLLTYRDFADGVLGLAWVAEPPGGNRGGVCEDRVRISVGTRSLNTAIVSFLNFGSRQSRAVTVITTAHEFGHNFGSPHDPSVTSPLCSPGGSEGNFLMFPRATGGELTNNRRFSPCSVDSIRPVLEGNSDCFSATGAFCGNGVLETGEECDCGTPSQCAVDPCCMSDCMLRPTASCSASQDCCNSQCQFEAADFPCAEATDCALAANCTGSGGNCPNRMPKPGEQLLCNNFNGVCVDGACAGSVCEAQYQLSDCQCTGVEDQLCDLCCVSNDGECLSTFSPQITRPGQRLESASPCNDFAGYCNTDNPPRCITVNSEDVLDDLRDLFSIETLSDIVDWLRVYWYVPIIVVVGIIIFMLLLHFTYRKRLPIQKSFRNARNSIRRGRTSSEVARQQARGVGAGAGEERRRRGPAQISQREGMNRLRHFFPTANTDTIMGVLRVSSDEGKAVRQLLELGFPLRKVPIPQA